MRLLALFFLIPLIDARGLPEPLVKNLRARYDVSSNSIYVEWDYQETVSTSYDTHFVIRYRLINRMSVDSQWKLARTSDRSVRLHLPDIQSGDELEVQVKVERGGQVIEDWSQQLLITFSKRLNVNGVLIEEGNLMPPLDFAANVIGPSTVKLEWQPYANVPGVYYIVNVKQLTQNSGENQLRQQIKIEATNFILNDLIPGEKYEITIRSATSPEQVSSTAAIVVISMPKEDEYFEVGNLIISSQFRADGRGVVNLTWEVPPEMAGKIKEYQVQYAPSGATNFNMISFDGNNPSATLYDLQSDTEYILKIKTFLTNNLETESGEFKFKTPKVAVNPISKVDVIYSSSEANVVRLQWILEPHVQLESIAGYDVFISENKDAPEQTWRYMKLDGKEASMSISDLKTATIYYVKINIRKIDGQVMQAPSIYRFKTIDSFFRTSEMKQANSLAYRNVAPGKVSVSWSYPQSIAKKVTGATILYSDRKTLPLDQWTRINVPDGNTQTILLQNLHPGTRYHIQIIPRLINGEPDYSSVEKFEIRTDSHAHSRALEHSFVNKGKRNPPPQFQEMRVAAESSEKHLNIVSCNPDSFKTGCAWDEHCIASVDNPNIAWCVPDTLRDAIIKSASD
uniref:Fibronectin type-III domain-containing protein n=1 Tax=Panagrolaimus sp. JU765 TaxID=591449 RepID=A0AC34Q2H6_9BILA